MNPHQATVERHRRICDVHLLLVRGSEVLLSLRQGGYASGLWQVPSGHLEPGEHTAGGAAREAAEEIGVRVDPDAMELAHFMDHVTPGEPPRLGVFYRTSHWEGEPYNAEPDKCAGLGWFELSAPPAETIAYQAAALVRIAAGEVRSVFGWGRG